MTINKLLPFKGVNIVVKCLSKTDRQILRQQLKDFPPCSDKKDHLSGLQELARLARQNI